MFCLLLLFLLFSRRWHWYGYHPYGYGYYPYAYPYGSYSPYNPCWRAQYYGYGYGGYGYYGYPGRCW